MALKGSEIVATVVATVVTTVVEKVVATVSACAQLVYISPVMSLIGGGVITLLIKIPIYAPASGSAWARLLPLNRGVARELDFYLN